MSITHDYSLRGKCREMAEAAAAQEPTLRIVRGHYWCPYWGEQAHWWCVRPDGTVVDPTAAQFPSCGNGLYVEFSGRVTCETCEREVAEAEACIAGSHCYCSTGCYAKAVL